MSGRDDLSDLGDVEPVGVLCRVVLRSGDGGGGGMSRRQLLSSGIVGADGVSSWPVLWRQLGKPDGLSIGQLLCGGVVGGEDMCGRVLLSELVGGAGLQRGVILPSWERERGEVWGREVLRDTRVDWNGVCSRVLLSGGVDGDDGVHGRTLLQ